MVADLSKVLEESGPVWGPTDLVDDTPGETKVVKISEGPGYNCGHAILER